MPAFKLPVTHVVTIQDKEVGETRMYELCERERAKLALRDHLAEKLGSVGVTLRDSTLNQAVRSEFETYSAVILFEAELVFCNPEEIEY